MNFKKLCLALVATIIVSCDQNSLEEFDHAAQYVIEKPMIDEYLATHYFDPVDKEIKEIDADQTALEDDTNLQALHSTVNDVDYTMYSYVYEQGLNQDAGNQDEGVVKGSPDADDIVNVAYKLSSITKKDDEGEYRVYQESTLNDVFLYGDEVIRAWPIGLSVFRGGYANESDPTIPRQFSGTGKGFMIIPSGLGYLNGGSGAISPNESLLFKIDLRLVISAGEDL
ncbi:FKBP-type peptidyl-prolyl cis-trans isomerase [Wenyingzhuangia marina]|uniref:Uncharacterized protein n=1 Tax=Wenyingzhuangia marina TaxID=1195760 RepID=A0A1M5W2P8_9FLAO|nr:hypothetical protein [Wenyingzhuangia marina]GGF76370.1 hypothetical protein GCM10011397_19130 [Wenyingzhuangia marina]SHH81708.1 hypothetical protein SAMN05444281_2153 [Wenyingzhuangia marina]